MALGVWLIASWMAFMVVVGVAFFVWGWHSGQFRDVEASKRTMLEDREPEPWPRRGARRGTAGRGEVT
jgi:cbb3-type cytochrome oxidase maturation protein